MSKRKLISTEVQKMFQVNKRDARDVILESFLLTLNRLP